MDSGNGGQFPQERHLLALSTPLGPDKLLLAGFTGEEAISDPFQFTATMFSTDRFIETNSLIGRGVSIKVTVGDAQPRWLHGIVRRFSVGGVNERGLREYRADIVPWFWFLTRTADCRIFQNMTLPEIIQQVFTEYGFQDYELRLLATYPKMDYCVQYRESAFAFLSRWMEEFGVHYYFRHEKDRHVMVIGDHNAAMDFIAARNVSFLSGVSGDVTRWEHSEEFRPGGFAQSDFAFKTPSLALLTQERSILKQATAEKFEIFDFPAGYTEIGDGRGRARTRMEEQESAHHVVEGDSLNCGFTAGGRFVMARHAIDAEEGKAYMLTRVVHSARDETHYSNTSAPPSYSNSFLAVPADRPFRPQSRTPWPVVQGPQTAMVVGTAGEIIHTEKHGRVKLQFHWDRRGKRDDRSSCWVRVSQNTAGAGWGGVFVPHVGHEVIVSFLDGDPDRPMVTGRVYNGSNGTSIGMPAHKTQSGLRDHTGNEILMEGKSGSQDVRVTAVKDMNIKVVNDRNHVVDKNETLLIGADQTQTIQGHRTETVNTGETVTVNGGRSHTVNGIQQTTISLAETHTVGAGRMHNVGAAESITVGGLQMVNIGAAHLLTVGAAQVVTVTGPRKVSASAISESAKGPVKIKAGAACVIEATSITLKAGGSEIVMSSSGISLKGTKIVHKADDNITLNAGSGVKVKGGSIGEN